MVKLFVERNAAIDEYTPTYSPYNDNYTPGAWGIFTPTGWCILGLHLHNGIGLIICNVCFGVWDDKD